MRPCEAGSIQDAVAAAYEAAGGLRKVSVAIGVTASSLSYGTEIREDRPGGLGVNYLDRLGRMSPAAAREIAQHFAALAGGVFQPLEAEVSDLGGHCQVVAKEGGEAQAAAIRAALSGSLRDCERALRETDESLEAHANLRAALATRIAGLRGGRVLHA